MNRKKYISIMPFVVCAVISTSSAAQEISAKTLPDCLNEQEDSERLECYDRVLGFEPKVVIEEKEIPDTVSDEVADEPSSEVDDYSQEWVFNEEFDQFDGSNISDVYLDGQPPSDEDLEPNMRLYLICDGDGAFDIVINAQEYLGSGRKLRVRYRFDNEDPITESWIPSTNGTAVWLPAGYRDFRSGLGDATDLLFEVTAFNGATYQSSFEGLSQSSDKKDFVMGGCQ